MPADGDGNDRRALRTVLREFARLGDRPEILVEAVSAIVAEPRWPTVGTVSPATASGPTTHPFGPRPPRPDDDGGVLRRRRPRRVGVFVGAAVIVIGAMHVCREHTAPSPTTVVAVSEQ